MIKYYILGYVGECLNWRFDTACVFIILLTSSLQGKKKARNTWLAIFVIILCRFATDEPLYVVDVELCGYSASWVVLMLYRHLVD